MCDELCDARAVFEKPSISGASSMIPSLLRMHSFELWVPGCIICSEESAAGTAGTLYVPTPYAAAVQPSRDADPVKALHPYDAVSSH